MQKLQLCPTALWISLLLMAGCAGLQHPPQHSPAAATAAETTVLIEPQATPAAVSARPQAVLAPAGTAASAPAARAAGSSRPGPMSTTVAKPPVSTAQAPLKPVAAPPPVAPPVVKPAGPLPLDLKSLEMRLKETKAIGVFSKLALKNQIDDLLERFRAFYQGRDKTSLVELRRSFDMLVMKALALLQDADAALAAALASSRESIWRVLSDRTKFATV